MDASSLESRQHGYSVPPEVYDIACGWDPRFEIARLLEVARWAGVRPESALELGCGTGRLLSALREEVPAVCGLELSPAMVAHARRSAATEVLPGDMTDFDLGRRFDLVFTSANTIRHVLSDEAVARMWQRIRAHLSAGGVFVADLELGFAAEAAKVGKSVTWAVSRGGTEVRTMWRVTEPPSVDTRCCGVVYAFEARGAELNGSWQERFSLRTYEATEFLELARRHAGLEPRGIYEIREPYLLETLAEKASGRYLVALRNPGAAPGE